MLSFGYFLPNLGYSGDVWYPQPAPKDHPWRYMPNQAMTPHISGTTIDAQVCKYSVFSNFSRLCLFCTSTYHNCKQTEKSLLLGILQLRYAAGTKDMLDRYFKGEEFPAENYIVKDGELAPQYR